MKNLFNVCFKLITLITLVGSSYFSMAQEGNVPDAVEQLVLESLRDNSGSSYLIQNWTGNDFKQWNNKGIEVYDDDVVVIWLAGEKLSGDLSGIDLSGLIGLYILQVHSNSNLTKLPQLPSGIKTINSSDCDLTELDLSDAHQIEDINISYNPSLGSDGLTLPILTHLKQFSAGQCGLTELDLSDAHQIEDINIFLNPSLGSGGLTLPTLTHLKNFDALGCSLSELDLSDAHQIEHISINGNSSLGSDDLILPLLTHLKSFQAHNCGLTELDLTGADQIEFLRISGNLSLGSGGLTLPTLTHLKNFDANGCSLSELDLTGANSLTNISVDNNYLNFTTLEHLKTFQQAGENFTYCPQNTLGIPETFNLTVGDNQTLTYDMGGTNTAYQWQKEITPNNWGNVTGANSKTLILSNITTSEAGKYRLKGTNTTPELSSCELYTQPFTVNVAAPEVCDLVVNSLGDNVANDGVTTLRAAIECANSTFGFDTIKVDINLANGDQEILLESALPVLSDTSGVFFDGGIYSNGVNTGSLVINSNSLDVGLSLSKCDSSYIQNVSVINATEKGIWLKGASYLNNVRVSAGNGVGVLVQAGGVTVTNSFIHDNVIGLQSALDSVGTVINNLFITNTHFYGNTEIELSLNYSNGPTVQKNYFGITPTFTGLAGAKGVKILNSSTLKFNDNYFWGYDTSMVIEKTHVLAVNNYFGYLPNGDNYTLGGVNLILKPAYGGSVFSGNSFYTNLGKAVVFDSNYVSDNVQFARNIFVSPDESKAIDLQTLGNGEKLTPSIESYLHGDTLKLMGYSERFDSVEIYYGNGLNENALTYLATASAQYDNKIGRDQWQVKIPTGEYYNLNRDNYYIAIATAPGFRSSELSLPYLIPQINEDGVCLVTNTNDDGTGSLRQSIIDANAGTCDKIHFAIPNAGPYVIQPETVLPYINASKTITIDGATQSSSGVGTGSQEIILDGSTMVKPTGFNSVDLCFSGNDFYLNTVNIQNFQTGIGKLTNSTIKNVKIEKCENGVSLLSDLYGNELIFIDSCNFDSCQESIGFHDNVYNIIDSGGVIKIFHSQIVSGGGIYFSTGSTSPALSGQMLIEIANSKFGKLIEDSILRVNAPIYVRGVKITEVYDCEFFGVNGNAFESLYSDTIHFRHNFIGKSSDLISTGSVSGIGVSLGYHKDSKIESNHIVNTGSDGIRVQMNTGGLISLIDNFIGVDSLKQNYSIGGLGVNMSFAGAFNVVGNRIGNTKGRALSMDNMSNPLGQISYNHIKNSGGVGIWLVRLGAGKIEYNILDSIQGDGIYFENGRTSDIKYNSIKNCKGRGMYLSRYSTSGDYFTDNEFINNGSYGLQVQVNALPFKFVHNNLFVENEQGGAHLINGVIATSFKSNVFINNRGFGLDLQQQNIDTVSANYFYGNTGDGLRVSYGRIGVFELNNIGFDTLGVINQNLGSAMQVNITGGMLIKNNKVAFEDSTGLNLLSGSNNQLSQNLFYTTGTQKAIDLNNVANKNKTKPELLAYSYTNTDSLKVSGKSTANDKIELFSNNSQPQSATTYLGATTSASNGNWSFTLPLDELTDFNDNYYFVATATDTSGNTSELSAVFKVKVKPEDGVCLVTKIADIGDSTLRQAITDANSGLCDKIHFAIPGAGPYVIEPQTVLPTIDASKTITIDGATQLLSGVGVGSQEIMLDGSFSVKPPLSNLVESCFSGNKFYLNSVTIQNFNTGIGKLTNSTIKNVKIEKCKNGIALLSNLYGNELISIDSCVFDSCQRSIGFEGNVSNLIDSGGVVKINHVEIVSGGGIYFSTTSVSSVLSGQMQIEIADSKFGKLSGDSILKVGAPIYVRGIKRTEVYDCEFFGVNGNAFESLYSDKIYLMHNFIGLSSDLSSQGSVTGIGVSLRSCNESKIEFNHIVNTGNDGVSVQMSLGAERLSSLRNNFIGVDSLEQNYTIGGIGINMSSSGAFNVVGNKIGNTKGRGLSMNNMTNESGQISYNHIKNCGEEGMSLVRLIAGVLEHNKLDSIQGDGIYFENGRTSDIKYNSIKNCKGRGMYLSRYSTSGDYFIDNEFINNGSYGLQTRVGDLSFKYIRGNKFQKNQLGGMMIESPKCTVFSENVFSENKFFGMSLKYPQIDTLSNNYFFSNEGYGLLIEGSLKHVANNYFGFDTLENVAPNKHQAIQMKSSSNQLLLNNHFAFEDSTALNLESGSKNIFSKNLFYTNGNQKAIKLGVYGNNQKSSPKILDYRYAFTDTLFISGKSKPNDLVEVFLNDGNPQNATHYLATAITTTDSTWQVAIIGENGFSSDDTVRVIATATDTLGNTSELSTVYVVPEKSVETNCIVTTLNDFEAGSLREAITCANRSAAASTVTISFDIDTTVALVLPITTPLPPLSRYGYRALLTGPNADNRPVSLVGDTTLTGISGNRFDVTDLQFSNFQSALSLGNNTTVENVLFENNQVAVTIEGNINVVQNNRFLDQDEVAIRVNSGNNNQLLSNYISKDEESTTYKAIDLVGTSNNSQQTPTNITYEEITGTILKGEGISGDKIQVFLSTQQSEEAYDVVAQTTVETDRTWSVEIPNQFLQEGINDYFVVTATSSTGNTSELSEIIRVGNDPVRCYVTNELDAGKGSLRDAVACVTDAELVGLSGAIIFHPDSAEHYNITLLSPVVGQNEYGIELSKDSANTVALQGIATSGLVFTGNNIQLADLTFENFDTALVVSGNNTDIDNITISKGKVGLITSGVGGSITNSVFGEVEIGLSLVNATATVKDNFFGANRDSSANAIQGYGISLWQSPNVAVKNNMFGTITPHPTLPLPENGSAIYVINGSSKLEIRDNDFTLNSDTTMSTIAGNAVFISGDNPQAPSASNFTSNEATIVENDVISSASAFNLHQVSNTLIEGNRIQSTQADAIIIDAGKGNKILNTEIYRTPNSFKGISLVNLGNDTLPAPTLDFIDFFDAKGGLFVNGVAPANTAIEFFEASSIPQTAVKLLKRTQANEKGEWSVTISKDNLNLNGTNYFTATARDAAGNTSELATDLSITINACMVTKTADAGDSTLRDAIVRANNSECNLVLFDISPLDTTQNYITIETALPALTKSNTIIDASSEVGFKLQRGGGVVTVIAEDSSLNGFRISGTHGVPVHGLNVENLVSGVVIENTTKTTWDYSQFLNNGTAVNVVSGTDALLQFNRVVGNETGQDAKNGFIISGQDHEINENDFTDLTETALQLTGSGHKADTNNTYNIGQNSTFEVGKAAYVLNNCSNVLFSNNSADTASVGFYFSESDSLTLVDLNANASSNYGFYFNECDQVNITRSQVDSCGSIGLYSKGGQHNLFAVGVSKATNTAISLEDEVSPTIQKSFLTECGQGISLVNSKSATIDENYLIDIIGNVISIDQKSNSGTIINNNIGLEGIGNAGVALTLLSDSNTVENNKVYDNLGGGIVTSGQYNRIVKNLIGKNDTAEYKPSTKGIDLSNGVGNVGITEPEILGKFTNGSDSTATITVSGTGVEGDTIHLYINDGWYESALKYIDKTVVGADEKWAVVFNKTALLSNVTSYGIATATNEENNTSEFSNIFPLGDCYVVSNKDNGDNDYPPTGSYRKAIGCLNVQQESTNLLFEIPEEATIKLEAPIDSIYNRFGFNYYGKNGGALPATLTKVDSLYTSTIPALRVNIDSGRAYVSYVEIKDFEKAVELKGDGIELDGLKLTGDTITQGKGVSFTGDSIQLNNLTLSQFELGVDATNATNLQVDGGSYSVLGRAIDASGATGIVVENAQFGSSINGSIYGDNLQKATIRGNKFGALGNVNFTSVWLENAKSTTLVGNEFSKAQSDNQNRFADEYTAHDIYISGGVDSLSIEGNKFLGGKGRAISFSTAQASNQYQHITIKKNTATDYEGDAFFIAAQNVVIDSNVIGAVRREARDTSLYISENNWYIDTVLYVVTGSNHAITVFNTKDVTLTNNQLDGGAESVVDIRESENVLVSRTTVTGFNEAVLPIDIHKATSEKSNNDKLTPEILRYEFILDSCAKYLYLIGTSEPFDEIELFFSDSSNYLNEYADSTIADSAGFWAYRVPPELYPKPQEEGLYYIATGSDTVHGTSQASNMLYIPPFVDSLLVKNTADTGAFSLREAIKAVNCSKFYSVVTFDFGSDFSLQTIALQTPLDTINSFLGFEMNGWGKDQYQVLIDGSVLVDTTGFGFYIDTASTEAVISHLAFKDFDTAMVVGNSKMQLSNLDISSTREGALGLHLLSNNTETTFEKSFIHDLSKGIRVDSANSKLVIKENLFQQVDSAIHIGQSVNESEIINNIIGGFNGYAIWLDSAGGQGNLIQSNYIGYDVNKAPNASLGIGVRITHANNQTVESNVLGNITGTGILLEGFSESNSLKTNLIGLIDSLTASPIDGDGIVFQSHGSDGGRPTTNFISDNTILYVTGSGISIVDADANNISTNKIGLNTNDQEVAMGAYAIVDKNATSNNYFNNTLTGYSVNGIMLENSEQGLISQNAIYSPMSAGDGIHLVTSNTTVQVPAITRVELIDTSKVIVTGTSPQANTRIELFKGYEGNKQSIDYVATAIPVNGVWTLQVSRSFFDLSETLFFTATSTDQNGSTSEFSEVKFIDQMLCKLPEDIDLLVDSKLVCPGIEVKLNAGLEGFNYEWTSDSLEEPETTQYLTVKKEAQYNLRMYDDDGCEYLDQFDLQLYEKASEPDYLVASEVFLGDTIVLVDLGELTDDSTEWAFDGAKAWQDTVGADYWKITFAEVKKYSISQINTKESCTTIQRHDINVLDPFFYTDSTNIFFHTLSIDEFTVNPSPNDGSQPFTVRVRLSKPADMTLMFFSEQGIRSLNTIELKGADTYEVNLPVTDLVSGTYIIRVFSYSISESKVVIISE